ncbi:MAG: hypothetical protein J6Y80_04165 [Victivallales bacterium]|nr:hypothetical protein [Victivallales bacterium]
MRKEIPIAVVILALISTWVWWTLRPPPSKAEQMGRIIAAVNHRQERVEQGETPDDLKEYIQQLFDAVENCDTERFRRLTHLQPKSRQLAILREIFFEEDTPFCPATILEYRRTRDTEEDQTLFPVDWRSSSLERSVRMYSSTRRLVRVHSEPRGQDYYLVFYNTSEGFTLLLAGTAR